MKNILIVVLTVCATTLQAAYIPKQWQTNEVALLPKKPFGGMKPVLLVQKISSRWHVVPLKDSAGIAKWNFDNVESVATKDLQKFPVRQRVVVEEFDVHNGEIYVNKSRRESEVPFIRPQ